MSDPSRKWQIPVKKSQEEKEIIDLLKAFSSALRKIPLYPASHPMVKDSIDRLFSMLLQFINTYGDLNLDVFENKLLICEQPFDEAPNITQELSMDFKKFSITGLAINEGLIESELENFLKLLTLKPEVIKERGGIKNVLASENITHIVLSEVHYARIKEEEEIKKKGEKELVQGLTLEKKSDKDIVGMVSDFLSGRSNNVPDKKLISYEFKKHSRRLVRQLLKLIGPEKAVDEVLRIIEERFDKAGFTGEEQNVYIEKLRQETIRLKQPKVTKKQLEKEVRALQEENKQLKNKVKNVDTAVQEAVAVATEDLRQENQKVKREKQRINSVLRHVAEGLVVVDHEGKVLLLNPAAEELLGVNKESKVGQNILEGIGEGQMISMSKDKVKEIEIELAGSDEQSKKTLRASNAVIENEDGQTIGVVSVLSDITKQKELERMKNTFLSNVTHDLRAPLISIQKSLSLFLDTVKDNLLPEQKQFLEIASNNALRLTNLVNDLLDVSKLESGRVHLQCTHLKLTPVVDEVFNLLSGWAESRKVSLKKGNLQLIEFDGDEKLLNQVFTNLIGNAIKFTPPGGSITVDAEYLNKDELKISVADTGCGIPSESFEQIFNKFEQAKTVPVAGAPKGTGLGLSIVKEIIQLHGGRIWVESEVGKGSKFIFVIPKEKEVLDIRD